MLRKRRTLFKFFIILFDGRVRWPINGDIKIAIQTVSKLNIGQREFTPGKVAISDNLRLSNRQFLVQVLQ